MTISERIQTWRQDAAVLRRYGAVRAAQMVERLAAELESDARTPAGELVDLAGAVALSGFTRGHLRRLVRDEKLRNLGSETAPMFRASELPRKPGYVSGRAALTLHTTPLAGPSNEGVSSRVQVARAVVFGD
jgi:hypothetical protein